MDKEKVNSPEHYKGDIEVIDYLKDKLTPEEFEGFAKGNILKYVSRAKLKNGVEDLRKASYYLNILLTGVGLDTIKLLEQMKGESEQ